MAISNDLAAKLLRACFQDTPLVRATTGEIRLYKSNDPPDADGTGGTALGSGHVAESVSFNGATWTVSGMTATNASLMTGNANGSAEVTATHYAIFDSSGNLMFVGALTSPIVIPSGAPYQIAAGAIDFTIGGAFTTGFGNDVLDHILTGAAITWPTASVDIELVSTAPSSSAAGTKLTGTAYVDLTVDCDTDHWSVDDNIATNAVDFEYGAAGSDWTDPRGHNIYITGGARMFFVDYGSSQPIIATNEAIWRAGQLAIALT